MEIDIRPLKTENLSQALELARVTYHACLENAVWDEQNVRFFYEYAQDAAICEKVNRGDLYVWGAIHNATLLGMGAITNSGQITMLYVLPEYQKQGIGSELLKGMKSYGPTLYLKRITVNASPAFTSIWFGRQGFTPIQKNPPRNIPFLAMECKLSSIRKYPVRHIPGTVLAALFGGATAISLLLMGIFVLLHLY